MPQLDLLALGNAIVDVIAHTEDDFLVFRKMQKGSMNLIDEATALDIYDAMGPATIISGGSAANTVVGAASLGLRTGFIGKVRNDEAGDHYRHDMRATGVAFDSVAAEDGPATARSFILVTPDGERTMNTYLGACQGLSAADVDADTVRSAKIVYLEGYLWDPPAAKDAFRKAVEIAHGAGNLVSLTLSDSFCVDRFRDEFLDLMRPPVAQSSSSTVWTIGIAVAESAIWVMQPILPVAMTSGRCARCWRPCGRAAARRSPAAGCCRCRPSRSRYGPRARP
jgi:sugar/nucleoside kinase (ribokinase family)